MEIFYNGLSLTKNVINNLFGQQCEPWQVASITASSLLTSIWIWNFIVQDESKFVSVTIY